MVILTINSPAVFFRCLTHPIYNQNARESVLTFLEVFARKFNFMTSEPKEVMKGGGQPTEPRWYRFRSTRIRNRFLTLFYFFNLSSYRNLVFCKSVRLTKWLSFLLATICRTGTRIYSRRRRTLIEWKSFKITFPVYFPFVAVNQTRSTNMNFPSLTWRSFTLAENWNTVYKKSSKARITRSRFRERNKPSGRREDWRCSRENLIT